MPNPEDNWITIHYVALEFMKELDFIVNPNNRLIYNVNEILSFIDEKGQTKLNSPV